MHIVNQCQLFHKFLMKVLFFSTHSFERSYLKYWTDKLDIEAVFLESELSLETVELAKGATCVSCWPSDNLESDVLNSLKSFGVEFISLRSAGFSHLNISD